MKRLMASTRTWNPSMWVGFTSISSDLIGGIDPMSGLVAAAVYLVALCVFAFILAAAVFCTLHPREGATDG